MEKNLMRSMELVGRERMEVAVRELFLFFSTCADPYSNNSQFGEKVAMTMFPISPTSLVFYYMKLVSWKIKPLIVMINTELL
jgi:hypothetical protein